MLTIHFGYFEEACKDPDNYFNYSFEEEWFDDPLVKEMVLDVDKSEVETYMRIKSPVFGYMDYQRLSGGVKTLILMYKLPEFIAAGVSMGDNCAKWVMEIGKRVDCKMTIEHGFVFGNGMFDHSDFDVHIENTNTTVHTIYDYYRALGEWVSTGEYLDV
jgi:hypothetical protein